MEHIVDEQGEFVDLLFKHTQLKIGDTDTCDKKMIFLYINSPPPPPVLMVAGDRWLRAHLPIPIHHCTCSLAHKRRNIAT